MKIAEVAKYQEHGIEIMTTFGKDYQGKEGRQKAIFDRVESYRTFLDKPESYNALHRNSDDEEIDVRYAKAALLYLQSLSGSN